VVADRAAWKVFAAGIDPRRLIFLDETFGTTAMTRLYGWGPTCQRVRDAVPHGHWNTTTFVAAFRLDGLFAPMVVDGALNGQLFLKYVQQELAPQLRSGDILVLDRPRTRSAKWPIRYRRVMHKCSICRHTVPTSTQSSRSSRRSRMNCVVVNSERSPPSKTRLVNPSIGSRRRKRSTTSSTRASRKQEFENALIENSLPTTTSRGCADPKLNFTLAYLAAEAAAAGFWRSGGTIARRRC